MTLEPAKRPRAVLNSPVVLLTSAASPTAVLPSPVVLAMERLKTTGSVVAAGGVVKERENTVGRVLETDGIVKEGEGSSCRVLTTAGIIKARQHQRRYFGSAVFTNSVPAPTPVLNLPVGVAPEREETNCCVEAASREIKERVLPFRRVAPRVAAVRGRDNCLCSWQKPEAEKRQCDEKWWSCFELNQWIHGSSFLFPAQC